MTMGPEKSIIILLFFILVPVSATAALSNESCGPFHPAVSQVLDVPPDGIFNFTSVFIASGVDIRFNPPQSQMPIYFMVTGDIVIKGSLDVSGLFQGNGGHLVLSGPQSIQVSGSILANGDPSGGAAGSISLNSSSVILENAHLGLQGFGTPSGGAISGGGSVVLSGQSGSVTLDPGFADLSNSGLTLVSGDLELIPAPAPAAFLLLFSGIIGLSGLGRQHS